MKVVYKHTASIKKDTFLEDVTAAVTDVIKVAEAEKRIIDWSTLKYETGDIFYSGSGAAYGWSIHLQVEAQ